MYQELNYGTKPSTTKLETVQVLIQPSVMIGDYAKAYVNELQRRNPERFKTVNLTEEDLENYFSQLVIERVNSVSSKCNNWRELKTLNIPAWIQFSLSCIGTVVDRDYGLELIPCVESEDVMDINDMLIVSRKLQAFKTDGVSLVQDAMPRGNDGDKDVMSMALVDGYMTSRESSATPISSYVAAFLGAKLKDEQTWKALYRVRFDDVNFIRQMLMNESSLF